MELIHKAKDIASGWRNFIDKSEVVEEVAKERADICAQCPEAKKSMLIAMIKDSLKEVEGYYCKACGCPLSSKIRSNSPCDLKKWL